MSSHRLIVLGVFTLLSPQDLVAQFSFTENVPLFQLGYHNQVQQFCELRTTYTVYFLEFEFMIEVVHHGDAVVLLLKTNRSTFFNQVLTTSIEVCIVFFSHVRITNNICLQFCNYNNFQPNFNYQYQACSLATSGWSEWIPRSCNKCGQSRHRFETPPPSPPPSMVMLLAENILIYLSTG